MGEGQYTTSRNLAARGSFQAKYATTKWFQWLAETLEFFPGNDILDVGCGPAWFWRTESDRLPNGLNLTLLDSSPGMIDEAVRNLRGIGKLDVCGAHIGDAVNLPFADEAFDVVLLLHVLYHVSDPKHALMEARRVLRPGGKVFLTSNTLDNMKELHVLAADAFGGDGIDPGAALFSLDDAEVLVDELFVGMVRSDLIDVLACPEPEDAIAFILSMPPGNAASEEKYQVLERLVLEKTKLGNGTIECTRRNGIVSGVKSA